MSKLFDVPIAAITALTPEKAVSLMREILRAECGYAKISPAALTITTRINTADGGVDAEICTPLEADTPQDCIFRPGRSGFQIKSGSAFKPWTKHAIRGELLDKKGNLYLEVKRLLDQGGRYVLVCTGHDLTPQQRNTSLARIAEVIAGAGLQMSADRIEVLGASQLAEFSERYPGIACLVAADPIQEAWLFEEWRRDAHMSNHFEISAEQSQAIAEIRAHLLGTTKHIRILGEPGLGKTRIALEAVSAPEFSHCVLYISHGGQFGATRLFRHLIKSGYEKPLILVIDELSESELADIWRHLKNRCGTLKIVSIDHGKDTTYDAEVVRINAPRLSDEVIGKILSSQVGDSREIDRWAAICEGSPRVAQAVAENLRANPSDILRPPSTVPIWERFLHGYGGRDEVSARQIDCVSQHLALFSRFGYELPVGDEAAHIAEMIRGVDPTIGWARFQEIVKGLRARRVLQGSRTLFFVPRALHIYLWKQFWENYGRGFDFVRTLDLMPESLHAWFMGMFKFAGDAATVHVVEDILRSDGVFSQPEVLNSGKGSRFLSVLAEANPPAVLGLLEATIGKWSDAEILDLAQHRQSFVWTLEKIAVWESTTVRALKLLARLAVNENASNSNNATGTLLGLFRIGPEEAATEASPAARLPALLALLRSGRNEEKMLGLKAMEAALDSHGRSFRMVGPEFQGLKERAELWIPATYGDWWSAKATYFQALIEETGKWPADLRVDVCKTLLYSVEQQIRVPPCTEIAFKVLEDLIGEGVAIDRELNEFFSGWQAFEQEDPSPKITKRLTELERRYVRRNIATRFRRYVIDVAWHEWDEDFRERRGEHRNRIKALATALAHRVARHPEMFEDISDLLAPTSGAPGLWHFGVQLACADTGRKILPLLVKRSLETKHESCLHGYLSALLESDKALHSSTIHGLLKDEASAGLGANIALNSKFSEDFFSKCLEGLEIGWIEPAIFGALRYGRMIETVPVHWKQRLFYDLREHGGPDAMSLLVELLDSTQLDDEAAVSPDFVFEVVTHTVPSEGRADVMRGHHWRSVCLKLVQWDAAYAVPLLNELLGRMEETYRLSYDSYVKPLADHLLRMDPEGAWTIISSHLEATLPKWRTDILNWLQGGLSGFDGNNPKAVVADLPLAKITEWIEQDPNCRAGLMAHAVSKSIEDEDGGALTREMLLRYGAVKGVKSGISAAFRSGGWTGPASVHLKKKRDKFRKWLAAGFPSEISQWIEEEIEYLDRDIEREEIDEERDRFE